MKNSIINIDKNDNYHGVQIYHYSNSDISRIDNYYHGKYHGYKAYYKPDNSINFKQYWNMDKLIYIENHWFDKHIEIMI